VTLTNVSTQESSRLERLICTVSALDRGQLQVEVQVSDPSPLVYADNGRSHYRHFYCFAREDHAGRGRLLPFPQTDYSRQRIACF
jgi:hypothetical protein